MSKLKALIAGSTGYIGIQLIKLLLNHRNIKIKPVKGKAALFFNLEKDNKTKLDDSFHAGLPPVTGVKWMCNVWVRLNKIPDIYQ